VLGLVTPQRAVSGPGAFLLARSRALGSFLPHDPVHPLVANQPAFLPQQAIGHPPPPRDVLSCDFREATLEVGLLDIDELAAMALGAAIMAHNPAVGTELSGVQASCLEYHRELVSSASSFWFLLGCRHHLALQPPGIPPVVEGDDVNAQLC